MSPPQSRGGSHGGRPGAWLPWLALFAAAVLVRGLSFGTVLAGGRLQTAFAGDEYYHLRRIWFTVVNFPASLDFDWYLNYPEGAASIWPPFFDWSIAALARGLVGAGDQGAVEIVAAWVPPLLGALAVLASVWLIRRTFSPAGGWATGALLSVLPAHVALNSALGLVDHHVAVGLLATLLVAFAARMTEPLAPDGRVRSAVPTGVVAAAAILLWPGALLHVVVVEGFLVVQLLASADRGVAVTRARALALLHAVAAALLLPFCVQREWPELGAWSPEVLSRFQPLWFAAGAGTLALVGTWWSRADVGTERRRRVGSALFVGVLGVAAAWLAVPGLAGAVSDASTWFGGDPFLQIVAETQPILYPRGGPYNPGIAETQFTALFWAYPLALIGLAVWAARRRRTDSLLVLTASAVACFATLVQMRFWDVSSLGFAWVMGPALAEGLRSAGRALPVPRSAWVGVLVLVLAGAAVPALARYRQELSDSLAARHGVRLEVGGEEGLRQGLRELARWAKRNTPPTQGYLDPTRRPEYGVLSAWGQGHLLRYYSERPMVEDNFGPWGGRHGFEAARRYYDCADENEAAEIADRLGARYVVATIHGSGQQIPRPGSMAVRLVPGRLPNGVLVPRGPALGRHRLVYVSEQRGSVMSPVLYEIVQGAQVSGTAPPGVSGVDFALSLALPVHERFEIRASAPVGEKGRYVIRLAYPSEEGWRVGAGGREAMLPIREDDVREGRDVPGPRFEP